MSNENILNSELCLKFLIKRNACIYLNLRTQEWEMEFDFCLTSKMYHKCIASESYWRIPTLFCFIDMLVSSHGLYYKESYHSTWPSVSDLSLQFIKWKLLLGKTWRKYWFWNPQKNKRGTLRSSLMKTVATLLYFVPHVTLLSHVGCGDAGNSPEREMTCPPSHQLSRTTESRTTHPGLPPTSGDNPSPFFSCSLFHWTRSTCQAPYFGGSCLSSQQSQSLQRREVC